MDLRLTQEEYEALVALARQGALTSANPDSRAYALEAFLQRLEKANGLVRHALWVRWQDARTPLPPTTRFPDVWPPTQEGQIELLSRAITRDDVLALVRARASSPCNVLVTRDPARRVGWTELDRFFAPGGG